jgi:hypothetical protein
MKEYLNRNVSITNNQKVKKYVFNQEDKFLLISIEFLHAFSSIILNVSSKFQSNRFVKIMLGKISSGLASERGDVPGWVLVVLMTTGLVTAIWTIAAPRLTSILRNSLDAMNGIR